MRKNTFRDCLMIGEIGVIGLAEVSHLAAVFLKLSFTDCSRLYAVCLGVLAVSGIVFLTAGRKHIFPAFHRERQGDFLPGQRLLYVIFAMTVISQLIFIGMGNAIYRRGDMMAETVESFLVSDGIYQVNPMTGMPYTEGMPLRLKILCLPTLYASLCRWTGIAPAVMVQRIVPMAVLLSSYVSFSLLGRALFPGDGKKRAWFLLGVSVLLWVGAYRYGMVGFGLLCSGWQGVAVRGGVLVPWTLSLCLRRRRMGVFLCILAEACIVWTLYGCGVCLAVGAGVTVVQLLCRKLPGTSANGKTGHSAERGDAT